MVRRDRRAAAGAIQGCLDLAPDEWRRAAVRAVKYCARSNSDFTTQQVWAALDSAYARPPEPRALGGVMRQVQASGFIQATGEHRTGDGRHGAPLRVWARVAHAPHPHQRFDLAAWGDRNVR